MLDAHGLYVAGVNRPPPSVEEIALMDLHVQEEEDRRRGGEGDPIDTA